jgi:transposase
MTRHEIQVLRAAKIPEAAVATQTGVSIRSVRRIAQEAPVTAVQPVTKVGRPSIAAPWATRIETWLEEDRGLPGLELVRRAEEAGYRGGKSALYELIRRLRPVPVAPMVRFEGVAGEFSQHDFGQIEVRYTTGQVERLRFFASRLKWSRLGHVTLVPDEREEALIRGLLSAFEAFGGVPLVTVWDNPKTVVITRKGELIVWNAVFGQVALDYRFAPELCWPRSGQQKGAVENLVGWVKGSFFKCRRFHDRADLEAQLREWLTAVNTQRPSRATGLIPAVRLAQERPRLRPLPIPAATYALKIPVIVTARGRVAYDGGEYSMPPATLGQPATLHLYADRVEIVTKAGAVVRHPRCRARGEASILPEHRTAMLAAVPGVRGRLYFQRQSLWELGPPAETWLTELIHRRPAQWRADVEQCFTLLNAHGPQRLLAALASGVHQGAIGAEYVAAALSRPSCLADAEPVAIRRRALTGEGRSASTSDDRDAAHTRISPLRAMPEVAR